MLINNTAIMKDLEMDEFVTIIIEGIILLRVLNSFSSRFFFFLDPAFLGFFGKSVKVLQDSS
jgi:hypothetical protein